MKKIIIILIISTALLSCSKKTFVTGNYAVKSITKYKTGGCNFYLKGINHQFTSSRNDINKGDTIKIFAR